LYASKIPNDNDRGSAHTERLRASDSVAGTHFPNDGPRATRSSNQLRNHPSSQAGAARYRVHGDYDANIDSVAKKSARQIFPTDARKQQEWELEYTIGWMMAAEAALWTP
jgi:hypothetical protein